MFAALLHADMRAGWSWRGAALWNCTDQHKTRIMKRRWRERDLGKQEAARRVHEEIGADTNKHGTAMWGHEAAAIRCRWEREQLLGEHWCCQSSGDADELRLVLGRDRQGRENAFWWSRMHWGGNKSSTRSLSTKWGTGDAVAVTAAAVMGEQHGKHSAHGGGIEGGGSKLLDLFQCLYTVQIYCRNTNRSKQTSPVFIYTHKIHTHTQEPSGSFASVHVYRRTLICTTLCALRSGEIRLADITSTGINQQTNKPDLLSL